MTRRILAVTVLVLLCGSPRAVAQPRNQASRWPLAGEVLRRHKESDPKAHAELMKLRTADPAAFRAKVQQLVKDAVAKDPDLAKRFSPRPPGRQGGAPARVPEAVKVVRDIAYAQYGQRKVLLDLYLPKKPPAGKIPCVMVVHGGGWRSGDKTRFARFAVALAEKGVAAACIGYRLKPEVDIPQCVEDAKAAVRWVRANADKHHVDATRIGAVGGSAGAHLVAMLGTSFKVKALEGNGGNEGVSSRVHAVVGLATPSDFTLFGRVVADKDMAKLISPAHYVDADSAEFLLMHAKGDRTVPYRQATVLLEKLQAAKVPAKLITLDSGAHAFWNGTGPLAEKALADTIAFFEKTLRPPAPEK